MVFLLVTDRTVYLLRKGRSCDPTCMLNEFLCVDGADHDGLDYSREVGIPLERLIHLTVSYLVSLAGYYGYCMYLPFTRLVSTFSR